MTDPARDPTWSEKLDITVLVEVTEQTAKDFLHKGVGETISMVIEPAVLTTVAKHESEEEMRWFMDRLQNEELSDSVKRDLLASIYVRAFVVGARFRDNQKKVAHGV